MPRPFANIEDFGARPAVITDAGVVHSHADIARQADLLAAPLRQKPGLLALEAGNALEPLLMFVGACRAGCPVMLLGPGDLAKNPLLGKNFRPEFTYGQEAGGWNLVTSASERAADLHPELAVLLSTSGSTGSAKLVRLSARNIVANAESIIRYLGIGPDERAITALPMQYSFGMSIVTSHLMAGASLLLTENSVLDACFWDHFRSHGATSFSGVPRTFEILDQTGFLDKPLPQLRTVTQAGGRLDPNRVLAMSRYAQRHGARFFVMYGQTEAAPRMSYLPPEMAEDHPDCIGIAVPGGKFRLLDQDGREIEAPETPGELCFVGPNVMMGYATGRACLARGAELAELRTGDIALRLANGLYRIVGRQTRFVKIAGLRLDLDDIEAVLRRQGLGTTVAGNDEKVVVAVDDPGCDTDRLKADLVARFKMPATALVVVLCETLPVLPSGKPDYRTVMKAADRAAPPAGERELLDRFAEILQRDRLGDHETFLSAGGDSLSFVEASFAVEDHFGRPIPGWERLPLGELCRHGAEEPSARGIDLGLDPLLVARSIAIGLAMTSHVFLKLEVWTQLPAAVRLVTRTATPAFLVIFGLGLARAYLGSPEAQRPGPLWRRFWPKIVTIYGAIVLTQACAVLGGGAWPGDSLRAILFQSPGNLVDLLMVYCGLYLLAPVIVGSLERWRTPALAVMFALPWVLWPWLVRLPDPGYFLAFLTGAGGRVGPSVLHATSFVLLGYCLGAFRRRPMFGLVAGLVLGTGVWLGVSHLADNGLAEAVRGIASMDYRRQNNPVYFAYGALGSLVVLGLSLLVVRVRIRPGALDLVFGLGANSIFAFAFGNMVLNLAPTPAVPLWAGLVLSGLFLGMLTLLTDDVTRTHSRFFGPFTDLLRRGMQRLFGLGRAPVFSRMPRLGRTRTVSGPGPD